ncbi:GntR family transcriptional regulator [Amorphus coralli]|uniref:GntR family transcriptional regulator n=1 Tax=Amorphus coralli TaxID=340680 RepID=UPI0003665BC8|nr:GntR family transcriptional regulator [Amorphus coralli]
MSSVEPIPSALFEQGVDPFADVRVDRKRPAVAQIYEQLRARILSLAVPPGATLSRAALSDRFGVSQQPVREAILRLEEEGLVETYPQSATKVAKIDLQSVREAQFLRLSVELEVVRMLALADGLDLFPIESLILQQERHLKRDDFTAFAEADREMHRTMQDMAGVHGLWGLIRSRSGHLDRLRHLHLPTPGKAQSIIAGHRGILAALEARDPEAAQAALRHHLSGTLASIGELRERFPDHITD